MDMKSKFMQEYPEVNAYVVYQQPQLKLRVGDFTSRAQATKFMEEIKSGFPTAFIVPDKVFVKGIPWWEISIRFYEIFIPCFDEIIQAIIGYPCLKLHSLMMKFINGMKLPMRKTSDHAP